MMSSNKKIFTAIVGLLAMIAAGAPISESGIVPDYQRFNLPNGMEVYLVEDHRLPMIDFFMLFGTGTAPDSSRTSGLCSISLSMLQDGTENFPDTLLTSAIDSTGGSVRFIANRDGSFIEGTFLSRDLQFSLEVLADMVQRPKLTETNLDRKKRRFISISMQRRSVATDRLANVLYNRLYGEEGYGLSPNGTRAGIDNIELEDIKAFLDANMRPNNATLFLGGDISASEARKLINRLFSDWQPGKESYKPIVNPSLPDSLKIIILDYPDAPSTDFLLGRSAVPAGSENTPALILFDYILGGGGEISRLWQKVVSEQSLATSVGSSVDWSRQNGAWMISGNASNDMAAGAILKIIGVIDELREIRVPFKELDEAKNFFYGYSLGYYESTYSSLAMMATLKRIGVDQDFYEKLTERFKVCDPNRLRGIAEKLLDKKNMIIVVSGPADILRPGLSQLGKIEVMEYGEY
ncbi:MAG: pitrilysin family protein [Candidatus Zixiibacteriota bacterium]